MPNFIAVDTGGTFTDVVIYDSDAGRLLRRKSLTTYDDLARSITASLLKVDFDVAAAAVVRFATTLVINTFVQRDGAVAALVTTKGFKDVLELARGNRTRPYDLRYRREEPLIPRFRRFEVGERVAANGEVLETLDRAELERLATNIARAHPDVAAVAISFLNAYANPRHEAEAMALLSSLLPGVYVTAGTVLSRESYEYERCATAAANAYVGPKVCKYLDLLSAWLAEQGFSGSFQMMASNGGAYSTARARREPLMLIESGPVGGAIGSGALAQALGLRQVVAFDMGGTTAKCCVVADGLFEFRSPYYVGGEDHGFPVRGAVLDIVEIGAGGGSLVDVDLYGRLSVGPRSAGSTPGPVCYARGGEHITITDANVVLGRIGQLVGGEMQLDPQAARTRMLQDVAAPLDLSGPEAADRAAQAIVDIGTLLMADAIREVTLKKGIDPREVVLFAYGGSGPVHAVELARELNIPEVVIPPEPGVFASMGMLFADVRADFQESCMGDLAPGPLQRLFTRLREVEAAMRSDGKDIPVDAVASGFVDLRYKGQAHALRVPLTQDDDVASLTASFEDRYARRYGLANYGKPIEFVGLAVALTHKTEKLDLAQVRPTVIPSTEPPVRRSVCFKHLGRVDTPIYSRETLQLGFSIAGPAIIEEYAATTLIAPTDRLTVGRFGELRIAIGAAHE